MNPHDRYRALRGLPPFPSIATKLLGLLEDDNVSVNNIVDLIKADAALTAVIAPHRQFPHLWPSLRASAVSRLRSQ